MLNIPESAKDIEARSKADVQRELNQSSPFLKNSWLGAIVTAAANRVFDFYLQLKAAIRDSFPDTATGESLTRWAAIWGKQLQAASKANGRCVATGVAGSVIPAGTVMTASGVGEFVAELSATIGAQVVNITSLTRSGSTVTATTASDHGLATGVSVTVDGAASSEYNTTNGVIVTGLNSFQYEIIGSPADEPGTSATASFTSTGVSVVSVEFGAEVNLDAGTQLRLQSPAVGVDDTLIVDYGSIGGGTNRESEASLRSRMLDRIQNPVANFNVNAITERAKEIPGVTRVFVHEVTPEIGQVTVYFMRDNDSSPIPTGSEVIKVKAAIVEIKPANTSDTDVIVTSPTGVPVNFALTDLTPNTSTMQTAISANLRQFFDERTSVGASVDEDAYRSAVFNTVDTVTGAAVQTFTLSSPLGDVAISAGEIGILGSVVYP